jgi:dihydroorotate dehydrogenase electron transfer subunit
LTTSTNECNPIFASRTAVVAVEPREGGHYVLWFTEPRIAASAQPGQFVTVLRPNSRMVLRRPFTIYRVEDDSVGLLVKVVGLGTSLLGECRPGDAIEVIGPIGHGFRLERAPDPAILVAGGTGAAVLPFLARRLAASGRQVVAFAGFELHVPLDMRPAANGANELVEIAEMGVVSGVATMKPREGCHEGPVTDLLERWLDAHPGPAELMACGPRPMLKRAASSAAGRDLHCQVSMEERMGCGIGACSGCVCRVRVNGKPAYRRVCVDGPVFEAEEVIW